MQQQPPQPPRPSTSPPCTCDEDEEEDEEDDHDHVVTTRPTSRAVKGLLASEVPPWDQRSRDSRMSRATTTRTAASANAFSSLASSAFQMPDNVFIEDTGTRPGTLEVVTTQAAAAVTLASDAISLEALSPRPFRSRSRTRSRAASHRYMLKEHAGEVGRGGGSGHHGGASHGGLRRSTSRPPDYHYHHELDRCRSFREGGLDDHIEFCKCTCDDRVTDYDEFILNETKVGIIFLFNYYIFFLKV